MTGVSTHNQTATQRRATIIEAAIIEFALNGYAGTNTEAIARRVGISQPYIFRLFGTKKDLFLAAADQVFTTIHNLFVHAAETAPHRGLSCLDAMGDAYFSLLNERHELLLLLQTYAASGDADIQTIVRARYRDLVQVVARHSGAQPNAIFAFFATGMMLTVAAALEMPEFYAPAPNC